MNRTFSNIVANVGSNVQDTSSAMATIVKRYVNDAQAEFIRRANITLIDEDYSFSTAVGTQDYVLPENFNKEINVYDATNKKELVRWELQRHIQENLSEISTAGQPDKYIILTRPVRSQPTAASTLSLVSSSASDTSQVVFIKGLSGGVQVSESVTLTGTTPVVTSNSYTEIISISKSATTVSGITATSNSGAVTVAIIPPSSLAYRVKVIRLHYVPSVVITVNVPYYMKPTTLVNDNDTLCVEADDIIEKLATSYAWRYKRQGLKAQDWLGLYEKSLMEYLWSEANQPNMVYTINPSPYPRDTV